MLGGSPQAFAAVFEISESGEVVTYSAPAVFTVDGARPISPAVIPATSAHGNVASLIREAADRQAINTDLLIEVARRESGFRQSAVSVRDAVGIMQLTAATALSIGVDRYDAAQNIHGGAFYLRSMLNRYGGDRRLALAAYNAGPGAVDRYGGVPPFRETRAYVDAILSRLPPPPAANSGPVALIR
jgi:soluble lytic murein transglycosylase-like protein